MKLSIHTYWRSWSFGIGGEYFGRGDWSIILLLGPTAVILSSV